MYIAQGRGREEEEEGVGPVIFRDGGKAAEFAELTT